MKYQWKSIGNPVEISIKFKSNYFGNLVEISLILVQNPVEIALKLQ